MDRLVFVDSDVLIDVLATRKPFFELSSGVLTLAEQKVFRAYTSPLILANTFYVIEKFANRATALGALKKIRKFIDVVEMNQKTVDQALDSDYRDFEDALEVFSAENAVMDFIVTRNLKDYGNSNVRALGPGELLALYLL